MENLSKISKKELEDRINTGLYAVQHGGNRYQAMATPIYLAEKSRRSSYRYSKDTKNISEQSLQLSQETSKFSKRTYKIVIVALLVSFTALAFSIIDFLGDRSWKKEQLNALQGIENNTKVIKDLSE